MCGGAVWHQPTIKCFPLLILEHKVFIERVLFIEHMFEVSDWLCIFGHTWTRLEIGISEVYQRCGNLKKLYRATNNVVTVYQYIHYTAKYYLTLNSGHKKKYYNSVTDTENEYLYSFGSANMEHHHHCLALLAFDVSDDRVEPYRHSFPVL